MLLAFCFFLYWFSHPDRDPQDDVPFAEVLYTNDAYSKSLYNALSDYGVIVLQLGASPSNDDPDETMSLSRRRAYLISSMERAGFDSLHVYDEIHCDFDGKFNISKGNLTYVFFAKSNNFFYPFFNLRSMELPYCSEEWLESIFVVPKHGKTGHRNSSKGEKHKIR